MTRLLFHTRPEVIIGASALLLAIWYIVSTIRQYIHLRHFGGPAIAGFTKFWMIRNIRGNRSHEELHEVCQKYGELAYQIPTLMPERLFPASSLVGLYTIDSVANASPCLVRVIRGHCTHWT